MQRFLLIIWLLLLTLTQVQADETSSIQGRVIDAQTKEPLLGVNVLVMGTQRGAATDLEGNYAILNLPVGTYRLKFDFIGYTSVLITDLVVKAPAPRWQTRRWRAVILKAKR
ncbi:carboxypeptidase-like regulatory domain-containing protein [candidate division KSB1 bacterium]|nr:carboxypeptidase-like regulatory domain-containing protein [candidate division KSB1 bacterium]